MCGDERLGDSIGGRYLFYTARNLRVLNVVSKKPYLLVGGGVRMK